MQTIYSVILAAGASRRLGYNKLTVKINGKSVIAMAVEAFCMEGVDKIFVVTNPGSNEINQELENIICSISLPLIIVKNPCCMEGMSTSIKASLPFINDADAVFFHLGDKPFIKKETIGNMLVRYCKGDADIIVPEYDNKKGHPVMVKIKPYLEEMKTLEGDKGLREIIDKYREDVVSIRGDIGSIFDIDTVETITLLKEKGYGVEESQS